jgi:hypothetical protein
MTNEIININDATPELLKAMVVRANGKRKLRTLPENVVEVFLINIKNNPHKSVQMRADAVANSYKYPAPSTYLRYNYVTKNIKISKKTFTVAGGDYGSTEIKKYNYNF